MVSIIDTDEYEKWSANFPVQYRPAAELLVRSLHYLDDSTFRSNLTRRILREFNNNHFEQPALLLPIRTGPEMGQSAPGRAVIFENVFPRNPLRVSNVGSEALCANIIRNLEKGQKGKLGTVPLPHHLDDLKAQKVRSIVLVGDYSGSGSQVVEGVKIWTRNRTIRSWRSYHLIKICVVLHSASWNALKALEIWSGIDSISTVTVAADFDSAEWLPEQRKDIEEFCARFARRRNNSSLGWNGSAGLFVMQHTVPNNLPMVLWQTKGISQHQDGWYPLFPERRVPEGIAGALAVEAQIRKRGLDKPGQDRVLGPIWLSVLDAIRRGARTPQWVSALADVSLADSTQVFAELADSGYIDVRGYLTDAGRRLLTPDARPMGRYRLRGSDEPYYPQALRRAGDV